MLMLMLLLLLYEFGILLFHVLAHHIHNYYTQSKYIVVPFPLPRDFPVRGRGVTRVLTLEV